MNVEEKFNTVYQPLVDEFISELEKRPYSDYAGIPHQFLPAWGKNYENALIRIAIVGKETRGWGPNLNEYIPLYKSGKYSFKMDRAEFQNLDFRDASWMGNKPTRGSFWGFWMNVLAKTYGVADWEEIKRGKYDILLDSFVWGNANAIETVTSQGVDAAAPGYACVKKASAKFDSIDLLVKVFAPHVVILTCADGERKRYLGDGFKFLETVDDRVSVYTRNCLYVFYAVHPNGQRYYAGGSDVFAGIMRDLLAKYNFFCPLPNVLTKGLTEKARKILVRECMGVDKYDAIAKVALELRKQRSYMSARHLCTEILNSSGHTTNRGEPFTGNGRGPCKLVSAAWGRFHGSNDGIAEDIALSFTKDNGEYAYE